MNKVYLNTLQLGRYWESILMLHGWGRTLESLQPLGEYCLCKVHQSTFLASVHRRYLMATGIPIQYADRILRYMDEQGLSKLTY